MIVVMIMKIIRTITMWLNHNFDNVNPETMLAGQRLCGVAAGPTAAYM